MNEEESNAFARELAKKTPLDRFAKTKTGQRAKFALGVTLSLVLAGCFTISLFLVGGLIVRGVRHGDYLALAAALIVIGMSVLMARRRKK